MSEQLADALSASAGGFFSCSVLYPIEICKNKLQSRGPSEDGDKAERDTFLSIGKEIVAKEVFKLSVPALPPLWFAILVLHVRQFSTLVLVPVCVMNCHTAS